MDLPTLEHANAHFVTDRLAVGGDLGYDDAAALEHVRELVDAGITHVLDVRLEADDTHVWERVPEVDYLWEGIDDAGQRVPAAWFEDVVGWSVAAVEAGGVVLAHCHMGINRGPSAGFAILLGLGWDPVDALDAIRAARPIAHVWYAEDALAWHFERTGASAEEQADTLARVRAWREANPLDVVRIVREQRTAGQ